MEFYSPNFKYLFVYVMILFFLYRKPFLFESIPLSVCVLKPYCLLCDHFRIPPIIYFSFFSSHFIFRFPQSISS